QNFYSIFLTDLKMPYLDGMQLIEEINKLSIPVTVMVMTGQRTSREDVQQAMTRGVRHILNKPLNADQLWGLVRAALDHRKDKDELVYLREELQARDAFKDIISKSPRMHAILELVENIAHTTTTVLIEGETGTGKEMVARAIHQASAGLR